MERYLQTSSPMSTLGEEASPRFHSQCMALRRFFLRQTLPDFQENWQLDLGKLAQVKKIVFDNLERTITATDQKGSVKAQAPSRVLRNTIVHQLHQAGANLQSIGQAWPAGKERSFTNQCCYFCTINGDAVQETTIANGRAVFTHVNYVTAMASRARRQQPTVDHCESC
jgi:hypothetical protein